MRHPEDSRLSRRQFVTTSGLIGLAGAVSAHAQASDPIDDSESVDQVLYENRQLDRGHPPLTLEREKTALAVIDMQRYFVNKEYPLGKALEKLEPGFSSYYFHRVNDVVVPNCRKLQKCFRSFGANIVYTLFGSLRADGKDMPGWARADNAMGHSVVGSPVYPPVDDPSCQVDDSLKPESGELVLPKNTSGPLNSTRLDQMLHTLGIDTLVVTGVVTDVCVTQTAREFADRDFNVVVVEDACATFDREHHRVALATFANVFGNVCRTDTVLDRMSTRLHK
ncbi:MAG: cysteine hydrolase [Candidatus Nealsonbacteria bacterium]|nr:cysteine hydrolase [Candidatus Nealsonbacteria bacterium]